MTIHDPYLYAKGTWDWGFLNDCFKPSRIKVTDLDGHVERNGHNLTIETKRVGAHIPEGQRILFNQAVKQGHWVLIIWGYQDNDTHEVLLMTPLGNRRLEEASKEDIQGMVRDWYRWADGRKGFMPEGLRPYLDRSLDDRECAEASIFIRQFNISVIWGFAPDGGWLLKGID